MFLKYIKDLNGKRDPVFEVRKAKTIITSIDIIYSINTIRLLSQSEEDFFPMNFIN